MTTTGRPRRVVHTGRRLRSAETAKSPLCSYECAWRLVSSVGLAFVPLWGATFFIYSAQRGRNRDEPTMARAWSRLWSSTINALSEPFYHKAYIDVSHDIYTDLPTYNTTGNLIPKHGETLVSLLLLYVQVTWPVRRCPITMVLTQMTETIPAMGRFHYKSTYKLTILRGKQK